MLLNALDFPSGQDALDAAQNGDRVYFPSTKPWKAPAGGFVIRRSIELFGDGSGTAGSPDGTRLLPQSNSSSDHVIALLPEGSELENVFIHDLKITVWTDPRPPNDTMRGGNGIHCETAFGIKVSKLRLARLVVLQLNGDALHLRGLDGGPSAIMHVSIDSCFGSFCRRGMDLLNVLEADIAGCGFISNLEHGVSAYASGVGLSLCGFDSNWRARDGSPAPPPSSTEGTISLRLCNVAQVRACHLENFLGGSSIGVFLSECGGAAQIGGCYFVNGQFGGTSIYLDDQGQDNGPVAIETNRHNQVETLINLQKAQASVLAPQMAMSPSSQILINGSPSDFRGTIGAPHIAEAFNVSSGTLRTSGFGIPDSSGVPAEALRDGMLSYDTTLAELRLRRAAAPSGWEPATKIVDANIPTDANINGSKLADVSIGGLKLIDSSISGSKLADASIGGSKLKIASFTGTAGFNIGGSAIGIGFEAELTTADVGGVQSWAVLVRQLTWDTSGGGAAKFQYPIAPSSPIAPAINTVLGIILKNGVFAQGSGQVDFEMVYIVNS